MEFNIHNRFTGAVQVTAEIECSENEATSIKRGLAVKWALQVGANLADAYLAGANLAGANLAGAHLTDAYLADAHLTNANLVGAHLAGAHLTDAYLAGALIGGKKIKGIVQLGFPDNWGAYVYATQDGELRVCVGCHDKSIAEGRSYWTDKEDRREVMAALDYAETLARLRGWIA